MALSNKSVLLLAIGNESRGDDAIGPLLARRMAAWLQGGMHNALAEVMEAMQLQIEHVIDIEERVLVLLIDAAQGMQVPFTFHEAEPVQALGHTSHALEPAELLGIFVKVHRRAPPPTFVVCVSGLNFGLGETLSAEAAANMEQAFFFCQALLEQPELETWRKQTRNHPCMKCP